MIKDFSNVIGYGQTSHLHSQLGTSGLDVAYCPKRGEVNKLEFKAYTQDRFFPRRARQQSKIPIYNENTVENRSSMTLALERSPYMKTLATSSMFKKAKSL